MPRSVVIFGRTIPLKYLDQKKMDAFHLNAVGLWSPDDFEIFISKDQSIQGQKRTLRHEVGHSLLTITGLDQVLPPEIQEIIVQSYAGLIEDVLKQPKKFK